MRPEKESMVQEIRRLLEDSACAFLADYRGLTMEQISELRRQLRRSDARLQIVKNAFLKRAIMELGWDGMTGFVDGPTAVVAGRGEATQLAKVLADFAKESGMPTTRGGRLGNRLVSPQEFEQLARMPSREVLLGRAVGTICAPMSRLVGVMSQKLASLLYVLKAVEEKKAKSN